MSDAGASLALSLMLLAGSPLPGQPSPNAMGAGKSSGQAQASSSSPGAPSGPGAGAPTSPFESQMLSYGAVDQIVRTAVQVALSMACKGHRLDNKVVIYDPASFAAVSQYQGFKLAASVLTQSYQ